MTASHAKKLPVIRKLFLWALSQERQFAKVCKSRRLLHLQIKNELLALDLYEVQRQNPLKFKHIQRKQLTLYRPSCHQKQQAASRLQDQMG
ncbi:hypothetical protein [Comamonas sp.]|uniref:hypothetical protein n=1 Tax=Comamonas sp. TaxID=34028 RepID=UPI003A923A62